MWTDKSPLSTRKSVIEQGQSKFSLQLEVENLGESNSFKRLFDLSLRAVPVNNSQTSLDTPSLRRSLKSNSERDSHQDRNSLSVKRCMRIIAESLVRRRVGSSIGRF